MSIKLTFLVRISLAFTVPRGFAHGGLCHASAGHRRTRPNMRLRALYKQRGLYKCIISLNALLYTALQVVLLEPVAHPISCAVLPFTVSSLRTALHIQSRVSFNTTDIVYAAMDSCTRAIRDRDGHTRTNHACKLTSAGVGIAMYECESKHMD